MDTIPLSALFGVLFLLIILSAFFSGSETGLMALNRYRLRHLVRDSHPGAIRAQRLLDKPDRLIGLILLGNNFVNILASSITTIIALRLMGEPGIAVGAGLLTLVILIFAEVTPKTLAALHPERIAFPASFVYGPLLKIVYPLVWSINVVANRTLKIFGISPNEKSSHALSSEELRTVVMEAGVLIPKRHQKMLLSLLDLEQATVEDIMVPRNEIAGIDISDPIEEIINIIGYTQYTRLPVYDESIDNVVGMLHIRRVLGMLQKGTLSKDALRATIRDPYFIPEGTSLNRQLLNFQREGRRIGLVVDEYGEILGLATVEDILEEVVGEFTTDPSSTHKDVTPQEDGTFLIDASATVRELNRALQIDLPLDGPKTLNGLILEHMEAIPEPGTSLLVADYPIEIMQTKDNAVKTVRLLPRLIRKKPEDTTSPSL